MDRLYRKTIWASNWPPCFIYIVLSWEIDYIYKNLKPMSELAEGSGFVLIVTVSQIDILQLNDR